MSLRPLRIAGSLLVILLGLVFAAAWAVPPLLDWNSYRDTIAALVSEKLGRAVRIQGPISLSLLPQPVLKAGRISVADAQDGVTIGLAELRLRLALGPLLSGHVDAQELELRGLDVRLPWPVRRDPITLRAPTWLSSLSARIEDGRLSIGGLAITGIAATLGTLADTGSYALAGQAQLSGQAWHMTARLSRPGADGTAGLDLSLDGQGPMQGLGAMFSGQIAADGTLAGRINGRGPDLSRLLAAPPVPFHAEGRLSLAAGIAIADQLALQIAGSPARGAVTLRLSPALRLDVSLAASRLDLDTWLPQLLRRQTPATASLTQDLPTGIDLSAEAATLGTGTLRGLRGRFEFGPGSVGLREVSAVLPGDARLLLDGNVTRISPEGALHFEGPASLDAPNLRTSLAWLAGSGLGPFTELPPGVLRTAALAATISADTGATLRIALTGLRGVLDDSKLTGSLTLRPALGTTPRLGLSGQLAFDRLELDPWIAGLPTPTALPGKLGRFDLDLRVAATAARLMGHDLSKLALDIATEPGRLVLRQAEATSMGVHASALFTLQDGLRLADARLELQAGTEQTAPFLAAWAPALAPLVGRLPRDPLALTVSGGGPADAIGLRATVDLGDLHLEMLPVLNLPALKFASQLTLRHPGAPRLLDSVGLPGNAAWLGDGSLSLIASLSGDLGRLTADSFDLSAGSLRATGTLTLDGTSPPTLTGRINAETLPLPLPYLRARDPLPTDLLGRLQANLKLEAAHVLFGLSPVLDQAAGNLTLANRAMRLDGFTARIDGGTLAGQLGLDAAGTTPALTANLALTGATITTPLFELPLDITAGGLDATLALTASGHSPQALLSTLSGTARLMASGGELSGVGLGKIGPQLAEPELRAALSGGNTPFTRLDLPLSLRNGAVTIGAATFNDGRFTASLGGLVDIIGRTNELRLAVRPDVPDPPEIAVRLSGNLDKPTRTLEIANALAWRAQHP